MSNEFFKELSDKYPFVTVVRYASAEYVGIVQNRDTTVTTLYDFGRIVDLELKQRFLELANVWWWESNRSIPINIFLREEWSIFKPYLNTFINKDLEILLGPCISLSDLAKKRTKKKSITLVRRVD
jgi:hypothetical protein|tara:strand:- start:144 stop:521 length:378 start_codon:yes stop_codon:yes gene_type:complete